MTSSSKKEYPTCNFIGFSHEIVIGGKVIHPFILLNFFGNKDDLNIMVV